jgi:hypothetical protein
VTPLVADELPVTLPACEEVLFRLDGPVGLEHAAAREATASRRMLLARIRRIPVGRAVETRTRTS